MDTAKAPLIHAHFPELEVPEDESVVHMERPVATGLRAADLASMVDTAFNGEAVSQVLENQRTYDVDTTLATGASPWNRNSTMTSPRRSASSIERSLKKRGGTNFCAAPMGL